MKHPDPGDIPEPANVPAMETFAALEIHTNQIQPSTNETKQLIVKGLQAGRATKRYLVKEQEDHNSCSVVADLLPAHVCSSISVIYVSFSRHLQFTETHIFYLSAASQQS